MVKGGPPFLVVGGRLHPGQSGLHTTLPWVQPTPPWLPVPPWVQFKFLVGINLIPPPGPVIPTSNGNGGGGCQRALPSITAASAIVEGRRNEQKEADLNPFGCFLRWRAGSCREGWNTTKAKASWNRRVMRAVFPRPDEPCNCVITGLDLFIHLRLHVSPSWPLQQTQLWNDPVLLLAAEITYLAKLQTPGIVSRK